MFHKILAAACALGLLMPSLATAHGYKAGDLDIAHPWARPTIPNRPTAAYLGIENHGDADRLLSATSPLFGAVEIHAVEAEGDIMKMQRLNALELPAGEAVTLEPGGHHLMLFDAEKPVAEGERFPLVLVFEKAGEVTVEVVVERRGPDATHDAEHGHTHPEH